MFDQAHKHSLNSAGRNAQKPAFFYSEPMICNASFVNYNKIYCAAVYA